MMEQGSEYQMLPELVAVVMAASPDRETDTVEEIDLRLTQGRTSEARCLECVSSRMRAPLQCRRLPGRLKRSVTDIIGIRKSNMRILCCPHECGSSTPPAAGDPRVRTPALLLAASRPLAPSARIGPRTGLPIPARRN